MPVKAIDFINPDMDEFYYHSMRVSVNNGIQGSFKGLIHRHLKTYDGFCLEIKPDNKDTTFRMPADKVTLLNIEV